MLILALWVLNVFRAVEATLRIPFVGRAVVFESSMEGVAISVVPARTWTNNDFRLSAPNPWQKFRLWPRFDRYYSNGRMGMVLPQWMIFGVTAPMAVFGLRQVTIRQRIEAGKCVRCTYQVDDIAVCPECGLRNRHPRPARAAHEVLRTESPC